MLNTERKGKREMIMKAKRTKGKGKLKLVMFAVLVVIIMITAFAKGNTPKIVGYTYASGSTVWEIATENCPKGMDVRYFAKEIAKANGLENNVVYEHYAYKIPVFESESENEYLDMSTVVGYELSDDGVMLLTNDGNGYFIEK